jgi:hypothetical protein
MIDVNTFLTILYVMIDDFNKGQLPVERPQPGRKASLSRSEVMCLAIFSQWYMFRSHRDFYRWAERHLRAAFPQLPDRGQFNRLVRHHRDAITAFSLHLVELMGARHTVYEVLDTSGVPVRNVKRRGRSWLAGLANVGMCTRLGWYHGFRLLIATSPIGVITGFGFGAGSAKEQPLTEVFLGLRFRPDPHFPSVGQRAIGYYLADKGFAGAKTHQRWEELYHARMVCEPQTNAQPWPKDWQRWLRSLRQIVETTFDKLIHFFRLADERPHDIAGFQTNLAAKIALHNFCIWLNKQLARPPLAFANLLLW